MFRLPDEDACQRNPLPFPPAAGVERGAVAVEAEVLSASSVRAALPLRQALHPHPEGDSSRVVFWQICRSGFWKRKPALRAILARPGGLGVEAADGDLPGGREQQAVGQPADGRFARPVGAGEGDKLALFDFEAEARDNDRPRRGSGSLHL